MRHVLAVCVVWLAGVASVSAQVSERLEIGAIVRTDRVSFEGGQNARLPVTGVGVAYRVWRDVRIEGEVTMASGESRRSYEGDFISYAEPGATREEFQRMAVIARRTTINKAGLGFATAVAVETREPGRVNLALRAGVSVRQVRLHRGDNGASSPRRGDIRAGGVGHAGWSRTARAQRAAVWRQCADSHRRPPSRRAGSAMGVGRPGTDWQ